MISYIGANKHRRNKTDLGFHLLVEGVSAQKMVSIYYLESEGFKVRLKFMVSSYGCTPWFPFEHRLIGTGEFMDHLRSIVIHTYPRGWMSRLCTGARREES